MNPREKRLAIFLGLAALLIPLYGGYRYVADTFLSRNTRLETLKREIANKEITVNAGQRAAERLARYEQQALPSDTDLARTRYQSWLLDLAQETVGFEKVNVNLAGSTPGGEVYHRLKFSVSGIGDVEKLTRFLYEFYSADHLHRIQQAVVKPVSGTKQMGLAFSIEALSLPGSDNKNQLSDRASDRLQQDLAFYQEAIVGRNIFGPPNQKPSLSTPRTTRVYTNESMSLNLSGSDPDKIDRLSYSIDEKSLSDARVDPRSGRVTWRPRRPGSYEVRVKVEDDGFPRKSDEKVLQIVVTDRPPRRREPEPPPKPRFDVARFTKLTSIVKNVEGVSELWLLERPTGKRHQLKTGDEFEVGSVKGRIDRIDVKTVEISIDGKRYKFTMGDMITDGTVISEPEIDEDPELDHHTAGS